MFVSNALQKPGRLRRALLAAEPWLLVALVAVPWALMLGRWLFER